MGKSIKTNAMRILDSKKIPYKELVLDIKEALDGVTCATMLGEKQESTFKTLVTIGKSGIYYVFVVPVARSLDLKKAACAVGEKDIVMLPMKELLGVTGYVHGGCSPIGMKKVFKTVIYDEIVFSGGKIGYFIKIKREDIDSVMPVLYASIVSDF